jgi:hypothetical protein
MVKQRRLQMDNHIRVIPNALSDEQCDYLIDGFEKHPELHEIQENANGKTLTRLNLMGSSETPFKEDLEYLSNVFLGGVREYRMQMDIQPYQFPSKFSLEAMKIKKYEPNGKEGFPDHIDVNSLDNCKRFLVMFIYLENNVKGATTLTVKREEGPPKRLFDDTYTSYCQKGNMLIFPPYWPWVHAGEQPLHTPKYIIGSYLHYV